MGLFNKLTKVLGSKAKEASSTDERPKALEDLMRDARLHARYALEGTGIATVLLKDDLFGVVKDISYGGLAVSFQSEKRSLPAQLPSSTSARFALLDQTVELKLTLVRLVHQDEKTLFAAFSISHESSESLLFLKDLIEPLRCGKTLVALAPEVRSERYSGHEWTCLRGEGPCDLIMKKRSDGDLETALLTFRIGQQYCELSFRDGQLATGRMLEALNDGGAMYVGSQMATTNDIAKDLLRHAIYVLTTVPSPHAQDARPILKAALAQLGLSPETPARPRA